MKRFYLAVGILASMLWLQGCKDNAAQTTGGETEIPTDSLQAETQTETESEPEAEAVDNSIPEGARALIKAYPDFKLTYKDNHICFEDGTKIVYDDGKEKSFQEQLDESDIEDMFSMPYDTVGEPGYQHDGGRSRCEALYKKMYGHSAEEVRKHLVKIDWFGQKLSVSTINGVDKRLKSVADDIAKDADLVQYAHPSSGTFNWRMVRRSNRLSAHSYGITIDVNTHYSDYWQWSNGTNDEMVKIKYKNSIPMKLVKIFQRHGFIWGGHWYHYDTMHFEYRPDILIYHGLM